MIKYLLILILLGFIVYMFSELIGTYTKKRKRKKREQDSWLGGDLMEGHNVVKEYERVIGVRKNKGTLIPEQNLYRELIILEKHLRTGTCPDCGGELSTLKTCNGDPEGIRRDRICTGCSQKYGQTKSHMYKM